jgi:hypothetical protein
LYGFSSYSVLPFVLCDKKGAVIFDLDRDCIFNRSSDFCPRMAKEGVVLAAFCWTKSLLCNVPAFHRDAALFRVYSSATFFKKIL